MTRKRKGELKHRVIAIAAVVTVFLSVVITVNDGRYLPFLPTWQALFAACGFQEKPVAEENLRVTVLDVGNADCILVESGGYAALIDAGENDAGRDILTALRLRGITRLDLVIATHGDADHIGAMDDVLREVEVGRFITPFVSLKYRPTTQAYADMVEAMTECGVTAEDAEYGAGYFIGKAKLTVLSGQNDVEYTADNDRSMVCRITFGEHAMLLMGDVGATVEDRLLFGGVPIQADVIKVGHHGSNTSTQPSFIKVVDPDYAIITCSLGNSYGHPHQDTIKTLQDSGVQIYRSDLHGDIVITSDGKTLSIDSER